MIAWVLRATIVLAWVLGGAAAYAAFQRFGTALAAALAFLLVTNGITALIVAIQFALSLYANRSALGIKVVEKMGLKQTLSAYLCELGAAFKVFTLWQAWWPAKSVDYLPAAKAAEPPKRGVLFLHGYFCNSALWFAHRALARERGVPHIALTTEPAFGSIDDYLPAVKAAVQRLSAATGLPPVIVGHSMGGLVARAYVAAEVATQVATEGAGAVSAVHRVITIGTPHHGTAHAERGVGDNARQMRLNSPWLAANAAQLPPEARSQFVCFYSNGDNIVAPTESAMLEGADNRHIPATGHVNLIFAPAVLEAVFEGA
jgi:triacylglycerol lipase